MTLRTISHAARGFVFALAIGVIPLASAHADGVRTGTIAQGAGAAQRCHTDADCHARMPAPRACPHGGTSTATSCCRMEYCGICWSDCPAGRSQDGLELTSH